MPFTLHDLRQSAVAGINKHLVEQPKKSKYRNQKVTIDGIVFDSKRESARYIELRMLLKAGAISDLKCQVPYELNPGGTHSLKYIADFEYILDGKLITEDVKGYRTREYKKKAKLMREVHGIEIREV